MHMVTLESGVVALRSFQLTKQTTTKNEKDSYLLKDTDQGLQTASLDNVFDSLLDKSVDFDVSISGDSAADDLLFNVRRDNLHIAWTRTLSSIGRTLESVWKFELEKWSKASKDSGVKEDDLWKVS